jgi:hypothetical protein
MAGDLPDYAKQLSPTSCNEQKLTAENKNAANQGIL